MAEFVTVRHPDVQATARVARSALAHMSGWEVVEPPAPKPAPKATKKAAPKTRRAAATTPSTPERDGDS